MKIFLLDVDNTISPFQPTAELYKRIFLNKPDYKHLLLGYYMIIMLNLFWYLPVVVLYQRRLIMSLLARTSQGQLEQESEKIATKVIESYHNGFKKILSYYKGPTDKIFLLTHCPDTISDKIAKGLGFNGGFALAIKDYFGTKSKPDNFDKGQVIKKIRLENPGARIYYFADDLIDLGCLLAGDEGILVNASSFTKIICRTFFKKIKIWD